MTTTLNATDSTIFAVDSDGYSVEKKTDKLVLVRHDIRLWSGQARLVETDLNLEEGKPLAKEEVVAASGQKWLIDRETIRPFLASKKRFISILEANGVRFMGGYGVPASRWNDIRSQLDKELGEFRTVKENFLNNYESNIEAWAVNHPALAASIRQAAPTLKQVSERIRSGYLGCKLNPIDETDAQALEEEIGGLSEQLAKETSQAAANFVRFSMKDDGTRPKKSLKILETIVFKLRGLSFIAPGCAPFSTFLENHLALLRDDQGKIINGMQTNARLLALTAILTNEETMNEILNGKMTVETVQQRLESMLGVPQKEEPQLFEAPSLAQAIVNELGIPKKEEPQPCEAPLEAAPAAPVAEPGLEVPATLVAKEPEPVFSDTDDIAAFFAEHADEKEPEIVPPPAQLHEPTPVKTIYQPTENNTSSASVSSWF